MIRVAIIDDHALVRAGLEELLAGDDEVEVVATGADGAEAVAVVERERPDLVLMDLSMPNVDGVEATRRISQSQPDARVVALTSYAEPDELRRAIRAAARGESPLSPRAATAVVAARAGSRDAPELSPREVEVLALVAEGLPNKLIARRLDISEKTVKAHLTQVFQQIGVSDRTQAAIWARNHGVGRTRD